MELEDFSNGFDVQIASFSRNGAFGDTMPDLRFDEYEKSVFLTRAQEDIVLGLYTGKNPSGESFEQTEELRRYLANLVVEDERSPKSRDKPKGMEENSFFFDLPDGVWFITYESVKISNGGCSGASPAYIDVYPVKQDEYNRIRRNPFRGASSRRALRLDLGNGVVEIISTKAVTNYYIRYLTKPSPIILINLEGDGMEINGEKTAMGCNLHSALHQRILNRAVTLALQSKGYTKQENN